MPECFTIYADKIEGRIDPFYYRPEFYELVRQLEHLKWKIVKLSDIFEINRGGSPRPIHKFFTTEENGVNWIKIGDTKGVDKYIYKTNQKIKPEGVKFSREVKEGDFILSNSMSFGRPYIMKTKGCIHDGWLLLREKDKDLNKEFLYYLLSTNFIYRFFKRATLGGVVENLNIDLVKEIRVPIPSLHIQNKIVSLMDSAYSSKKSKESEALNLLDSINDYVLDELGIKLPELEDKRTYVVNSDEAENKRIDAYYYQPKFEEIEKAVKKGKFEVKELKDSLDYHKKGIEVGSNAYIDEGIPFIRIADIDDYKIKYAETDKKIKLELYEKLKEYQPKKDELLFSKDGSIGFCVVVNENKDSIISGGILRLKVKKDVNNFYIKTILSSKFFKILTERESIGSIIKHLTPEVFLSLKIPLPPLSVQNKIADEVKRRMQKAEHLQKEAKEELEKAKQEVEKIILGESK